MKNLFFIPLLLFFISCGGGFFEKGPFFWKAEKDGRVLHILGTIHVGVNLEDLKCSEEISQSFAQSNLLFTEVDEAIQLQVMQSLQQSLQSSLLDASGESFENLNEESQNFFKTKLQAEILDQVERYSYSGLNTILTQLCQKQMLDEFMQEQELTEEALQEAFQKVPKLDIQILNLAQDRGIPTIYLDEIEGIELALRSLLAPTDDVSSKDIERDIKKFDKFCVAETLKNNTQYFENMKQNYLSGQDIDLFGLMSKQFSHGINQGFMTEEQVKILKKNIKKNLLKKRNEIWLEKIISAHQQEANREIFVAGGTGHFTEDYNVLDMLKREGFTIKRYNTECLAEESY